MNQLNRMVLYLFIFTVPFQRSIIIPYLGSLNKVMGIVLVMTAILTVLSNKSIKKLPITFIMLFLFLLLNLASLFWGATMEDGINKLLLYSQLMFTFWAVYEFIDTKSRIHNVLKAFVLGCTVIALQSLYSYLTIGSALVGEGNSRFALEGYNPNGLGIIWAFGLVIAAYLIFNVSRKYLLYIPLSVYLIFLTGSRTALILTVIAALATLWYMFRHKVRFRKTVALVMLVSVAYVYFQIPQAQLDRLATIDDQFATGDLNGRTAIWQSGIRAMKESPIFGEGIGSFQEVSAVYSLTGTEMSSHNSYLSILVENGMIGFIIFFAFVIGLFIYAWKTEGDKNLRWLSLTLISLWLVLSFASHSEAQKYTWIIFGIIISIYYINKKISVGDGVENAI